MKLTKLELEDGSYERALQDPSFHNNNHKQIMLLLSHFDAKINLLIETILDNQALITAVIDLLSRSKLKGDKDVKNELKGMKRASNVIDDNIEQIKNMIEVEKNLKMGLFMQQKEMQQQKQTEKKEDKSHSHSYL